MKDDEPSGGHAVGGGNARKKPSEQRTGCRNHARLYADPQVTAIISTPGDKLVRKADPGSGTSGSCSFVVGGTVRYSKSV